MNSKHMAEKTPLGAQCTQEALNFIIRMHKIFSAALKILPASIALISSKTKI
jgi:hypothetical protein